MTHLSSKLMVKSLYTHRVIGGLPIGDFFSFGAPNSYSTSFIVIPRLGRNTPSAEFEGLGIEKTSA